MILTSFSLFSTEPMVSNLWGSSKTSSLHHLAYISEQLHSKSFPKNYLFTQYICIRSYSHHRQTIQQTYSGLKTLTCQELFSQGFFNGRCPRPGNFKEIKPWAVEKFQCFTSQKKAIEVPGIPPTVPQGQMHRDISRRAAQRHSCVLIR